MQFIIAFFGVTKNRAQRQRTIVSQQHRGKAFIVRAEQKTVAPRTVAQPLLFADVTRQNQTGLPAERREDRFVLSEYRRANCRHQVPGLSPPSRFRL